MFKKPGNSVLFIWITGLMLGISIIMITGMILLIISNGTDYYIPKDLVRIKTKSGESYLGQITNNENIPDYSSEHKKKFNKRIQLRIANREFFGHDFIWLNQSDISKTSLNPTNAFIIERLEFGNFIGYIESLKINNQIINSDEKDFFEIYEKYQNIITELRNHIRKIEKNEIGAVNYEIDILRTKIKKIGYKNKIQSTGENSDITKIENEIEILNEKYLYLKQRTDSLTALSNNFVLNLTTENGEKTNLPLIQVYEIYSPNSMNFWDKFLFAINKLYGFIFDEPRESNTEGGIFPAIFGTIMMVMLMSLAAVPLGVMTALYLREYAKQGWLVRMVRIAVNNLAGVPSIVFGIFGLGFFIYTVGGTIDYLFFPEILPTPTWGTGGILWASLTLALLTVPLVVVSTEEALDSIPVGIREASIALGATKWQTTYRIILPTATPGIMTGVILAMARGAGEVAPLMITGVVKLAPALPFDWNFPFIHPDRKFMHLGFHIYDVGFQSPNIEAAMPMVYMTTLLLIIIVLLLNLVAISIRNRLKKKFENSGL